MSAVPASLFTSWSFDRLLTTAPVSPVVPHEERLSVNKTPSKPSLRAHARVAALVPGALVAGVLLAAPASAATTTVSVCSVGCDFTTISAAVSAASAGDTIDVQGGTYTESVAVSKPLTIRATTPGTTVVPGPGFNDAGFKLQADDVTIQGFTIGDRSAMNQTVGIDVASTNGTRILDDIIVNNQRGVSLNGASDTVVSGTRFSDNNGSGPDNNAGLWGDAVTGITVENSTFVGHTNTAVNLAGSSHITITGSKFDDNGNVAVIWGDTDVTVSDNVGTMMRGSGVYLNQSSNVTISGNDLAARGGTSAVSVNNVSGPNSTVLVTHNVLRDFARGVGIANGALSDPLVASGNAFLTTTAGVRNLGSTLVDARGNWWGAASGPADPTAGDSSLPETNSGTGVSRRGCRRLPRLVRQRHVQHASRTAGQSDRHAEAPSCGSSTTETESSSCGSPPTTSPSPTATWRSATRQASESPCWWSTMARPAPISAR